MSDNIPALCEHAEPSGFWVHDDNGDVLGVLCFACGSDAAISAAVLKKAQAERRQLRDAAPALLEALREMVDKALKSDTLWEKAMAQAQAAIAQATGTD